MLAITVNGHKKKFSIGCRTFVSLDVLMKILDANDQEVNLNGEAIHRHEFAKTTVNGGDTLGLALIVNR
ncbi:MAG: hypothetical protein PVSMB11_01370 [Desulfuromonadaceae bacterium]